MGKIYLAAPFFNEEQETTIGTVEAMCQELGWDFFSPRIECFCPPNASDYVQQSTFKLNIKHIELAPMVLARIDDFDTGTIWELGYAYKCKVPVVVYTTFETGRGLNLMLAKGCIGFIQGLTRLRNFLKGSKEKNGDKVQLKYSIKNSKEKYPNFEFAKQWVKEII